MGKKDSNCPITYETIVHSINQQDIIRADIVDGQFHISYTTVLEHHNNKSLSIDIETKSSILHKHIDVYRVNNVSYNLGAANINNQIHPQR